MAKFAEGIAETSAWLIASAIGMAKVWHLWVLGPVVILVAGMSLNLIPRPKKVTLPGVAVAIVIFVLMAAAVMRFGNETLGPINQEQLKSWDWITAGIGAFVVLVVAFLSPLWWHMLQSIWSDPRGKAFVLLGLVGFWWFRTPGVVNGLAVAIGVLGAVILYEQLVKGGAL